MEHAGDRRFARLAGLDRVVAHALQDLERMSLLTPVLVDRHSFKKYSLGFWHSQGESAKALQPLGLAGVCSLIGCPLAAAWLLIDDTAPSSPVAWDAPVPPDLTLPSRP